MARKERIIETRKNILLCTLSRDLPRMSDEVDRRCHEQRPGIPEADQATRDRRDEVVLRRFVGSSRTTLSHNLRK